MKLTLQFDLDGRQWRCEEEIADLSEKSVEIAFRTFECAYRRVVDEQKARNKELRAQLHRQANGHP